MSALKSLILGAVNSAEEAVSDLKLTCSHVKRGAPVHTPGSAPTYPETVSDVSVVFTRFKSSEIDGDRIQSSDWRALVFRPKTPADFKVNDLIRTVGSDDILAGDYRIIDDDKVLVGGTVALHQLHLRRT